MGFAVGVGLPLRQLGVALLLARARAALGAAFATDAARQVWMGVAVCVGLAGVEDGGGVGLDLALDLAADGALGAALAADAAGQVRVLDAVDVRLGGGDGCEGEGGK